MSKTDLPPGWSMPNYMAKRINEVMSQKPSNTSLDELMDVLGQTAKEIAQVEPEPNDWAGWITYLLEVLQTEAEKDFKPEGYETLLQDLRDGLDTRIEGGKW